MTDWSPHPLTVKRWERKSIDFDSPSPMTVRFGDVRHGWAREHAQRELTSFYRSLIDKEVLAAMPGPAVSDIYRQGLTDGAEVMFKSALANTGAPPPGRRIIVGVDPTSRHGDHAVTMTFEFIDGRWVVVNAKEDTMAKRGVKDDDFAGHLRKATTKKQRRDKANAARRAKRAAGKPANVDHFQPETQGLNDKPAPPLSLDAVAAFIACYMLECAGVGEREIAELFSISTAGAQDRINSGRVIAERQGIYCDHLRSRSAAIRRNMFEDFARKAAGAMQDRIAVALPAFIRTAETTPHKSGSGITFVVSMVRSFVPEDVVPPTPTPDGNINTASNRQPLGGAIIGRADRADSIGRADARQYAASQTAETDRAYQTHRPPTAQHEADDRR